MNSDKMYRVRHTVRSPHPSFCLSPLRFKPHLNIRLRTKSLFSMKKKKFVIITSSSSQETKFRGQRACGCTPARTESQRLYLVVACVSSTSAAARTNLRQRDRGRESGTAVARISNIAPGLTLPSSSPPSSGSSAWATATTAAATTPPPHLQPQGTTGR